MSIIGLQCPHCKKPVVLQVYVSDLLTEEDAKEQMKVLEGDDEKPTFGGAGPIIGDGNSGFGVCVLQSLTSGVAFLTEAIFENGSRCDVIDLDTGEIFEILHTETIDEAREKVKKYPEEFEVFFIKTRGG